MICCTVEALSSAVCVSKLQRTRLRVTMCLNIDAAANGTVQYNTWHSSALVQSYQQNSLYLILDIMWNPSVLFLAAVTSVACNNRTLRQFTCSSVLPWMASLSLRNGVHGGYFIQLFKDNTTQCNVVLVLLREMTCCINENSFSCLTLKQN